MKVKIVWLQDTAYCFGDFVRSRKKGEEDIFELSAAKGLEISGIIKIISGVKSTKIDNWEEVQTKIEE